MSTLRQQFRLIWIYKHEVPEECVHASSLGGLEFEMMVLAKRLDRGVMLIMKREDAGSSVEQSVSKKLSVWSTRRHHNSSGFYCFPEINRRASDIFMFIAALFRMNVSLHFI
jgi:hypothetical protein